MKLVKNIHKKADKNGIEKGSIEGIRNTGMAITDDDLDKVSGGDDESYESRPVFSVEPSYEILCLNCCRCADYVTPTPEFCKLCGMPFF